MTLGVTPKESLRIGEYQVPVYSLDTVIVGSGAAGLRCAVNLQRNLADQPDRKILVLSEDRYNSTSFNTGSDKQTFYTWGVARDGPDSPKEMAQQIYNGNSLDGDVALVQANMSAQAFYGLADLGLPFPHDEFGGYGGYQTDHSEALRGTSRGPLTSKNMVEVLMREAERLNIPFGDGYQVVSLIKNGDQVTGVVAIDKNDVESDNYGLTVFQAQNVVFAVGGPGGMYKNSVYPSCHNGAIGVALEAGARAVNLTESQHGLASIQHRWNVSGTYQQVVPRFVSTNPDGSDEREFLNEYFGSIGDLSSNIFLKGYQWPFDPNKIKGSSLIDILVHIETEVRGRRVFMDFRENPRGTDLGEFSFDDLSDEARTYLQNAGALFGAPIDRLCHMNPQAVDLYDAHNINIRKVPLEVAVCNQHNNGGLETDHYSESANIKHLFPIGEVAGQHGVTRPGGSALNAGQCFAIMAAERIAYDYRPGTGAVSYEDFRHTAGQEAERVMRFIESISTGTSNLENYADSIKARMTLAGAHIRNPDSVAQALSDAQNQVSQGRISIAGRHEMPEALRIRSMGTAQMVYLDAINYYIQNGGGSRGSSMVMNEDGNPVLDRLGDKWKYLPENEQWRDLVLTTEFDGTSVTNSTRERRLIPDVQFQFEQEMNRFIRRVTGN